MGGRPHARCVEGHHVWPVRKPGGEVLDRPVEVAAPLLCHSPHAVPAHAARRPATRVASRPRAAAWMGAQREDTQAHGLACQSPHYDRSKGLQREQRAPEGGGDGRTLSESPGACWRTTPRRPPPCRRSPFCIEPGEGGEGAFIEATVGGAVGERVGQKGGDAPQRVWRTTRCGSCPRRLRRCSGGPPARGGVREGGRLQRGRAPLQSAEMAQRFAVM